MAKLSLGTVEQLHNYFSKYLFNFIYKHMFFKVSHYVTFFVTSEFAIKNYFKFLVSLIEF